MRGVASEKGPGLEKTLSDKIKILFFQCKLEKKTVKKVKPETWCEKMSQNVCAPSNCVISTGEKV